MRSEMHRNHVTDAQTVHENLNGVSAGTHEIVADNSGGDMLASLEVALHWLGSAVIVAFIGLAIIEPERVERTLTPLRFKAPLVSSNQYRLRDGKAEFFSDFGVDH
jgi:hypothetical protein